jgi:hypothetical protein
VLEAVKQYNLENREGKIKIAKRMDRIFRECNLKSKKGREIYLCTRALLIPTYWNDKVKRDAYKYFVTYKTGGVVNEYLEKHAKLLPLDNHTDFLIPFVKIDIEYKYKTGDTISNYRENLDWY